MTDYIFRSVVCKFELGGHFKQRKCEKRVQKSLCSTRFWCSWYQTWRGCSGDPGGEPCGRWAHNSPAEPRWDYLGFWGITRLRGVLQTPERFHSTDNFAGYRFAFVSQAIRVRRAELQVDKVEVGQKICIIWLEAHISEMSGAIYEIKVVSV